MSSIIGSAGAFSYFLKMVELKTNSQKIKFLGQEYVFYVATKDIGIVRFIKSYRGA